MLLLAVGGLLLCSLVQIWSHHRFFLADQALLDPHCAYFAPWAPTYLRETAAGASRLGVLVGIFRRYNEFAQQHLLPGLCFWTLGMYRLFGPGDGFAHAGLIPLLMIAWSAFLLLVRLRGPVAGFVGGCVLLHLPVTMNITRIHPIHLANLGLGFLLLILALGPWFLEARGRRRHLWGWLLGLLIVGMLSLHWSMAVWAAAVVLLLFSNLPPGERRWVAPLVAPSGVFVALWLPVMFGLRYVPTGMHLEPNLPPVLREFLVHMGNSVGPLNLVLLVALAVVTVAGGLWALRRRQPVELSERARIDRRYWWSLLGMGLLMGGLNALLTLRRFGFDDFSEWLPLVVLALIGAPLPRSPWRRVHGLLLGGLTLSAILGGMVLYPIPSLWPKTPAEELAYRWYGRLYYFERSDVFDLIGPRRADERRVRVIDWLVSQGPEFRYVWYMAVCSRGSLTLLPARPPEPGAKLALSLNRFEWYAWFEGGRGCRPVEGKELPAMAIVELEPQYCPPEFGERIGELLGRVTAALREHQDGEVAEWVILADEGTPLLLLCLEPAGARER